ncbi:hypothetical protein ACVIIV_000140 [Bradyrhizobium sp. USDA 4354]
MTSTITAPIVASTMAPTVPVASWMCSWGNTQLATQRADDADDDVADQSKSRPVDNLARKPARDRADDERCDNSHCKRPQNNPVRRSILEQNVIGSMLNWLADARGSPLPGGEG